MLVVKSWQGYILPIPHWRFQTNATTTYPRKCSCLSTELCEKTSETEREKNEGLRRNQPENLHVFCFKFGRDYTLTLK